MRGRYEDVWRVLEHWGVFRVKISVIRVSGTTGSTKGDHIDSRIWYYYMLSKRGKTTLLLASP